MYILWSGGNTGRALVQLLLRRGDYRNMTPTEVKSLFKTQNDTRSGAEPFIYIIRGEDINCNSKEDLETAQLYGLDVRSVGQNDRLVMTYNPLQTLIKDLRHYQLFKFIGKFPHVKPADNTGHALTNKLSPMFMAATRLMLNQYYLNDPTHPPCAHSLKPKVA